MNGGGKTGVTRTLSLLTAVTVALLLTACATTGKLADSQPADSQFEPVAIGPFTAFSGRLIVIEPTRRWQVMVDWNGNADQGQLRLTHAASNRIIQLAWQGERTLMLDNQAPTQAWIEISAAAMAEQGIVLPPQQLATILAGEIPESLVRKKENEWEGRLNGTFLRITWSAENSRLELMDISHGRKATLIIQP